jgi:trehalose-6-phosphate synthase
MRVPSASLSWIEVDGSVSSTTRPIKGVGAEFRGAESAVGSVASAVLLLPRVLPTPWNGTWRCLSGSCRKTMAEECQYGSAPMSFKHMYQHRCISNTNVKACWCSFREQVLTKTLTRRLKKDDNF